MSDHKTKPKHDKIGKIIYNVLKSIFLFLSIIFMPLRFHGRKNVETKVSPFIIIANHKHWIDPIIMALSTKKHKVTFLAKKELFEIPLLKRIATWLNVIPVDRKKTDLKAIRACISAIRSNQVLGIFPEGTRYKSGKMEEIESGIALISLRSEAEIIPLYIPHPLRFFRKNNCYFGDSIEVKDLVKMGIDKKTTEMLIQRIKNTYEKLINDTNQTNKTKV